VIHVFSYEPGTKVSKQKRTIEFLISENDDRKLEEIRKLLVQHKVLGALEYVLPVSKSEELFADLISIVFVTRFAMPGVRRCPTR
jgi:predicted lipoprotein